MPFEFTITPDMKRQFASEVSGHLDTFEKMLLVFEKDPANQEAINAAFRAIHSIKGNSDYIGIQDMNRLANGLEDLMDDLRSGRIAIVSTVLSVLFEGADLLRDMNRRVVQEDDEECDISSSLARIRHIKTTIRAEIAPPPEQREKVDIGAVFARAASQHIEYIRGITERILGGASAKNARNNVLRTLTTLYTSANYAGFSDITAIVNEMQAKVEQAKSVRKTLAKYLLEKIEEVEALIVSTGKLSSACGVPSTNSGRAEERSIPPVRPELVEGLERHRTFVSEALGWEMRVEPEKVDDLMNQISELAIAKNTLNYLAENIIATQTAPEWKNDLKRVTSSISKISDTLQADIMKLRLVSMASLFERLPRIVRDLALQNNKKVELSLLGAETEIDRKVIEHLIDPMIHLIRNAVDHGIEAPSERVKRNKPESGTITLMARQEGNYAIIDMIDDGKGLHSADIKHEALKQGIIPAEAVASLSDEEALNLIFTAGYSTAPEVTSVSGRGVGLDVVRNNIKAVGGNVTLSGEPGSGLRVSLQVPLTMAVMDVLLTETKGECYAFPFSAILENTTVKRGDIQVLNKQEAVPYHGTVLGLRHLRKILGVAQKETLRVKGSDEELAVIVVTFGGQVYGVVVDRILRRETILIKPLEEQLLRIKEFSGAALLGDGSIVLLLDPMGMI